VNSGKSAIFPVIQLETVCWVITVSMILPFVIITDILKSQSFKIAPMFFVFFKIAPGPFRGKTGPPWGVAYAV
jgi:hypothetical protein